MLTRIGLALALAIFSSFVSAQGPVAAYNFNEGSGSTLNDLSGFANTGAISGATWTASGKNGGALNFDGVNDRVNVPASASLNVTTGVTLEAWVYPTANQSGWRAIVQREVDAYLLHASNNAGALWPAAGGTFNGSHNSSMSGPSAIPVNTWTHLAMTYEGSMLRLYVDGVQVASRTDYPPPIETNSNPLSIGGTVVYGEFFQGRIDDVRVYNRALSASEIQTDMATPVGGSSDTTAPSVTITSPTSASTYNTDTTPLSLSGTASDNVGVTQVTWSNDRGGSGTATGTTSWSVSSVALQSGQNIVTVTARDAANNQSTDTLTVTYTPPPQGSGIVAAYNFDEGSGSTLNDLSGFANTGGISGATWTASGKNGGALNFDGVNDRVNVPASASLNVTTGVTLEAWVYPTANQSDWRAIVQREDDAYLLHASNNTGALRPAAGGTFNGGHTQSMSGPSSIPVNTWTHLAMTYENSMLRLYVDGVQVASRTDHPPPIETNNKPLSIGGTVVYGEFFQGRIDDVRVYNRALSAAEIQTDMATPVGGSSDTTPPTAPTNLGATAASTTQINLSWTASTDNVGVTGYRVERCQGASCSDFAQIATPSGASFNDTGLSASTTYRYRVRAVDAATNLSGYSNVASATTQTPQDSQAPTAPSALAASAVSTTQINLSWTTSTDNIAVTGYRVERCQGSASCTNFLEVASPGGTSFSDTNLTPSTIYRYRVRATDAATNLSGYSNMASALTQTPQDTQAPSTPGGLSVTAASDMQLNLNWTASTDNVGVANYRIERCTGSTCTDFIQVATSAGSSFSDTGLNASTTYRYRVRAADAVPNVSGYSGIANGTTQAAGPAVTVTYEYDTAGRMTRATYSSGAIVDYTYDANGNRSTASTTGISRGTLALSSSTYAGGENANQRFVEITVNRTGGSFAVATVNYTTQPGTADGDDYHTKSGTLVWYHGDGTSKSFQVEIKDDSSAESPQSFNIVLSNVTGATLGTASASVSIADNDL